MTHVELMKPLYQSKSSMDVFISCYRFRREQPLIFILVNQEINKTPSDFSYISKPRVITVDKNPTYLVAIQALKEEKHMPKGV